MFAVKRSIIVDDSWQNHAIKSHECKQVWTALRSTISVVFEFKSRSYELKIQKPTEKNVPKYPPPPPRVREPLFFCSKQIVIHYYSSQIEKHVDKHQSKSSPSKNHRFVKVADK